METQNIQTLDEKESIRFKASLAAREGNPELLQEFFKEHRDQLCVPDKKDCTLLHEACCGGDMPTIKWLVSQEFDVNAINQFGASPLFEAVYRDNTEAAKYLKSQGAKLFVPRGNRIVSYYQLGMSAVSLLILVILVVFWDLKSWKILLAIMLVGITVMGIYDGVKGLRGKHTFGNS